MDYYLRRTGRKMRIRLEVLAICTEGITRYLTAIEWHGSTCKCHVGGTITVGIAVICFTTPIGVGIWDLASRYRTHTVSAVECTPEIATLADIVRLFWMAAWGLPPRCQRRAGWVIFQALIHLLKADMRSPSTFLCWPSKENIITYVVTSHDQLLNKG